MTRHRRRRSAHEYVAIERLPAPEIQGFDSLEPVPDGLRLRADGTVPVVSSRDVAEMFEKQHQHVLRDIRGLIEARPELDAAWFRPVNYVGEDNTAPP